MTDKLLVAQKALLKEGYTLTLYDGLSFVVSSDRGVKPLLDLYKEEKDYSGFSAADKVVGKAAAFLYVLIGIKELYASVVSESAISVFEKNGVTIFYKEKVSYIINRAQNGMCPMESAVFDIDNAQEAIEVIEKTLKKLENH